MQPASAHTYIRSGQIPFFRLPSCDLAAEARARGEVDAVILGVPWDGSVTYQPGARFASGRSGPPGGTPRRTRTRSESAPRCSNR